MRPGEVVRFGGQQLIRVRDRTFSNLDEAWELVLSLGSDQRYWALVELEVYLRDFRVKYGDFVEKVCSELETLKKQTPEWEDAGFKAKWQQVIETGKFVRKERNHIRNGMNNLMKDGWCEQALFTLVLCPLSVTARLSAYPNPSTIYI